VAETQKTLFFVRKAADSSTHVVTLLGMLCMKSHSRSSSCSWRFCNLKIVVLLCDKRIIQSGQFDEESISFPRSSLVEDKRRLEIRIQELEEELEEEQSNVELMVEKAKKNGMQVCMVMGFCK
jgi:hypothetical protein